MTWGWQALNYLSQEWRVIGEAPVIFASAMLLACFVAWAVARHQYADRFASLQERLNIAADRLKAREEEIAWVKAAADRPTAPPVGRFDLFERAAGRDVGTVLVAGEIAEFSASQAAGELVDRLRRAGWSVNTAWVGSAGHPPPTGIELTIGTEPSQAAISLLAAFSAADLAYDLKRTVANKSDATIHVFRRTF